MWKTRETKNYIFHYHENSYAEQDIIKIIETQENCYEYICEVLDVKLNKKLNYFLCDSPVEVGKLYGDNEPCNGFARMPDGIYAVYNDQIKCIGYHEDAHIISYNTLSRPPQNFIREGLAMFFDKTWWGISNFAWVAYFIENNKLPRLCDVIENINFHEYSCTITYPLSGAFTEYIISSFGIEKYKEFYKSLDENFNSCFQETFGISFDEAESKFIKYINNIDINKDIFKIIETELEE
ncbi:hypothetical protein SAMN05660462_00234 [Proteiniborus ethanoligenes]|uniref:Peptidase MA superfamily protein n=1 Tax=Proteiniborus ethanoligenes TaxID=415015 RepID=A0A1H3KLM5_9FIRM|nr:hypothetical protein [Proteiniborus ethanoligenes]SDY53041.1 hypothetical protein SAMN05660462_00234 [Proteiniborus ethanoligenes]